MRKIAKQQDQGGAEIDLTPMLDVVFIMLIFFIVVASFIKEAGIEINRPDDNQPDDPSDSSSIVVEITADNQIWMENRRVDVRAVRANNRAEGPPSELEHILNFGTSYRLMSFTEVKQNHVQHVQSAARSPGGCQKPSAFWSTPQVVYCRCAIDGPHRSSPCDGLAGASSGRPSG